MKVNDKKITPSDFEVKFTSKKKSGFESDSSEDRSLKRRRSSGKKRGRSSRSSSSSDSSRSRSRSRVKHKSKRSRSRSHDRRKNKSKSPEKSKRGRSDERRSKEYDDSRKRRSRSPEHVRSQERSNAEKSQSQYDYFSFSSKPAKIPGLGDSPTNPEGLPESGRDFNARVDGKKEFDEQKRFSDRFNRGEQSADFAGNRKHDFDPQQQIRQGMPRDNHGMEGNTLKPRQMERRMSVTPTKDEVSDKLGLEDISPEEHDPRNNDYRLRLYGSREDDYKLRELDRRDSAGFDERRSRERRGSRGRSRSRSRSSGDKYRRGDRSDRYSPEKRKRYSPDRRGKFSPGDKRSPDRRSPDRRRGRESFDSRRGDSRERRFKEEYSRDGEGKRGFDDKDEEKRMRERRIISMQKRDDKTGPSEFPMQQQRQNEQQHYYESDKRKGFEDDRDYQRKGEESRSERFSPGMEKRVDRRRESSDLYYDSAGGQDKRSIVVGQRTEQTPQRSGRFGRKFEERDTDMNIDVKRMDFDQDHDRAEYRQAEGRQPRDGRDYKYRASPGDPSDRGGSSKRRSKRSYSRSRSRSPTRNKRRESYEKTRDTEEESYSRVINVKSIDAEKTSKWKPLQQQVERSQDSRDQRDRHFEEEKHKDRRFEEEKPSSEDIFADEPKSKQENSRGRFSTYVPRSVKLKQQPEKSLNPERSEGRNFNQEKNGEDSPTINVNRKQFTEGSRSKGQERSPEHLKSKERSRKDSRNRSRSRSSSQGRHRKSSKRSRSRSRSRRSRSGSKPKRSKDRSKKSRSPDRYRKKSRSRSHSRGSDRKSSKSRDRPQRRSRSRSSSSSREDNRRISFKLSEKDKKELVRTVPVEIPKIPSRWDSPKEKKSRWEGPEGSEEAKVGIDLDQVHSRINSFMSTNLISKSPPPHRRMKPEEKKALKEKWKDLSVSPLKSDDEEKVENTLSELVRKRAAEVAARLTSGKPNPEPLNAADERPKGTKGKQNVEKYLKLKGFKKSKWESDSNSDNERQRSSKSKDKGKKKDKRRDSRSRSRSKDRRSRSGSRSRDRKRSRSKGRKSRSRSRHRSRSRSRDRRYSSSKSKEEQRVFWFHKNEVESEKKIKGTPRGGRGRGNRGGSRGRGEGGFRGRGDGGFRGRGDGGFRGRGDGGPRGRGRGFGGKGNRGGFKVGGFKPVSKSKWSSDDESQSEGEANKTEPKSKDSLNELEAFYNQLKEKKRTMSGDGTGN